MGEQPTDWQGVFARFLGGDRMALVKVTQLVTGHLARLGAYEHRESWEDVIQEVLIALVRAGRRGQLREGQAFVSYVGVVTRNELYDWLKRERGQAGQRAVGERGEGEIADPIGNDPPARGAEMAELVGALEQLPERERRVVEAIYVRGRSYAEAAREVGVPRGTVGHVLKRALAALRERLLERGGE